MKNVLITILVLNFLFQSVLGQTVNVESVFNSKTDNNSYVSDASHYLDSIKINQLNQLCYEIDTAHNSQIAIIILDSIGDRDPLAFATDIGNYWGVGKDDRGIIILVSVRNKSMAIATGSNIEVLLTDWDTKKIQENSILPYFKLNQYGMGLVYGVQEIQKEIIRSKEEEVANENNRILHDQNQQVQMLFHSKFRIYILFVMGSLIGVILISFLKINTTIGLAISIVVGGLFTLVNMALLRNEDSSHDVFASIASLTFFALAPLFIISFYRIYRKKLIWESVLVGILYLGSIATLGHYFYLEGRSPSDFYPIVSFWYWIEHPIQMGILVVTILTLFFMYKMLLIYSSSDPYVRYQRVLKFSDYFLTLHPVLFPFPFLTLQLYKKQYKTSFRNQPRYSKSSGLLMMKAEESKEDLFLSDVQEAEEKAKSADYDVWYSEQEGDVLVLQYKIDSYNKGKCESCGENTIKDVSSIITKKADYSQSGSMDVKVQCCNCDFEELIKRTIPRKVKASGYSGSNSSRSYSSSSRSYSSRSSSSRSSSGGSWGGGSFGGGGSKSSW